MPDHQEELTDLRKNDSVRAAATPSGQAERNVEDIMRLEEEAINSRSPAEHLADKVTTAAASAPSVIFHILWFAGWMLINVGLIPGVAPFDPFPFSLLALVVGLEVIFLTLLVLMSQNRLTKEAQRREHLHLQLNMLAEQEATLILKVVQRTARHLGLDDEADEAKHLEEKTDVHQLARTLDEKSPFE